MNTRTDYTPNGYKSNFDSLGQQLVPDEDFLWSDLFVSLVAVFILYALVTLMMGV